MGKDFACGGQNRQNGKGMIGRGKSVRSTGTSYWSYAGRLSPVIRYNNNHEPTKARLAKPDTCKAEEILQPGFVGLRGVTFRDQMINRGIRVSVHLKCGKSEATAFCAGTEGSVNSTERAHMGQEERQRDSKGTR